jgi:hypothetical protein
MPTVNGLTSTHAEWLRFTTSTNSLSVLHHEDGTGRYFTI